MKPKVVPTSPAGRSQAAALEELYQKKPDTLTQPYRVHISWRIGILLIIVGFVAGLVGTVVFDWVVYQTPHWSLWQRLDVTVPTSVQSVTTTNANNEVWNNSIFRANKSIVTIFARRSGDGIWDRVYHQRDAIGTAVILSDDGLLVTLDSFNFSTDQALIAVTNDGKQMDIKKKFDDPTSPLQFLTVEGKDLVPAAFVGREQLTVTQEVAALIAATGDIVTSRIANTLRETNEPQSSERLSRLLTLTLPINQASVVMTPRGDIVGITGADGLVVPLFYSSSILQQALQDKAVERTYLGIHGLAVSTPGISEDERQGQTTGVYLVSSPDNASAAVISGSPAAAAGLQAGDIITRIDDTNVENPTVLAEYIEAQSLGETVVITYIRDRGAHTASVTLTKLQSS